MARSQYSEGPATDHHDTGSSWFPCVYKQVLRWFPRFQVATTCFPCSPPDLNLLFISIFNQFDGKNLFHNKSYFMSLHVSSTCAHHQEVNIALHSLWHHHTYRWPSRARDTCPAHLILLNFNTRTLLGEEYRSFSSSLCSLLHSPVTSYLLRPNILLNTITFAYTETQNSIYLSI
jgi:hypothetical protein